MHYLIHPAAIRDADVSVPGDKSVSHRAIMLGSIAEGVTEVHGFLAGEDCLATMAAFCSMGVAIERPADTQLVIHGVGMHGLQPPDADVDLGNSGTAMRLMAGVLAGQNFAATLTGDESLTGRSDPLYVGGPVAVGTMTVLIKGSDPPNGAAQIIPGVHLIRQDVGLRELLESDPSETEVRFYAGYAGWSPGQLEDEIARGVWHLLPGDPRWVFSEVPAEVWGRLMRIVLGPTA